MVRVKLMKQSDSVRSAQRRFRQAGGGYANRLACRHPAIAHGVIRARNQEQTDRRELRRNVDRVAKVALSRRRETRMGTDAYCFMIHNVRSN
jgi:hypothetical protein